MSIPVIKAMTKRIRMRYGSTELAAKAAGVSKSGWSDYENADKPECSIPFHRLMAVANVEERKQFAALLLDDDASLDVDLLTEASEATEAAAELQGLVRRLSKDGLCENDKRAIRAQCLETQAQLGDVLAAVS